MRVLGLLGLFVLSFSFSLSAQRLKLSLSADIYQTENLPFLEHSAPGKFQSYVAMNLRLKPIDDLFEALQKEVPTKLKMRKEAHITVVTPPEFDDVLSKVLTIQEINSIAKELSIQSCHFLVQGLGRAQAKIKGRTEQVYFVIVKSEEIIKIRKAVFEKFVEKGGEPSHFDPNNFYSHITVGFTAEDLHESNGVKKGMNAFYADLDINE